LELGAQLTQEALDRICSAFAGAVLSLLLAEYGFGADGLDKPEALVSIGLFLSLALAAAMRMRARPKSDASA